MAAEVRRDMQSHDQSMGGGLVGFEQMELKSLPPRMSKAVAGMRRPRAGQKPAKAARLGKPWAAIFHVATRWRWHAASVSILENCFKNWLHLLKLCLIFKSTHVEHLCGVNKVSLYVG